MKVYDLKEYLLVEIFKALGLDNNSPIRVVLGPLFAPAALRFAELAVEFDSDVEKLGFSKAADRVLPLFTHQVYVQGIEHIPTEGPLLIASNHPGTYDGPILASKMPRSDAQRRGAEFFQVLQRVLLPKSLLLDPSLSFAEPLIVASISNSPLLGTIIARAKMHFQQFIGK